MIICWFCKLIQNNEAVLKAPGWGKVAPIHMFKYHIFNWLRFFFIHVCIVTIFSTTLYLKKSQHELRGQNDKRTSEVGYVYCCLISE